MKRSLPFGAIALSVVFVGRDGAAGPWPRPRPGVRSPMDIAKSRQERAIGEVKGAEKSAPAPGAGGHEAGKGLRGEGVRRFRTSVFEVPKTTTEGIAAEAVGPLGDRANTFRGSNAAFKGNYHALWTDIQNGKPVADQLALSNEGVLSFRTEFAKRFEPAWFADAEPATKLALLRFFARAGELGKRAGGLQAERLNDVAWPPTVEAAALLKRVAKAYGLNQSRIRIGGESLPNFTGREIKQALTVEAPATAAKQLDVVSEPIKSVEVSKTPLGERSDMGVYWSTAILANMASGKPVVEDLALNDASVHSFLVRSYGQAGHIVLRPEVLRSYAAPTKIALLNLLSRSAELNKPAELNATALTWFSSQLPATTETAEALRRAVAAYKLDEAQVRFAGGTLAEFGRLPTAIHAESKSEIGNVRPTADLERVWAQVQQGRPLTSELALSDEAVGRVFTRYLQSGNGPRGLQWLVRAAPESRIALLRILARTAEQGHPSQGVDAATLSKITLPKTAEAVSVVRRLARAYRLDERQITFAGGPLARFDPARRAIAEKVSDLGQRASISGSEFETLWQKMKSGEPVAQEFAFSDAGLDHFFARFNRAGFENTWFAGSAPKKVELLRMYARIAELGMPAPNLHVAALNLVNLSGWPQTKETAAALMRVAKAYNLDPNKIDFGKTTLAKFRPNLWARLFGGPVVAEKEGPLGTTGELSPEQFEQTNAILWSGGVLSHDLKLDDAAVRGFFGKQGERAYGNLFEPGIFAQLAPVTRVALLRAYARAAEKGKPATNLNAEQLSQISWPETRVAAEVLRRVAAAYKLDEQKIKFGGTVLSDFTPEHELAMATAP